VSNNNEIYDPQVIQLYFNVSEDHTDIFLSKLGYEMPKHSRSSIGLKTLNDFYLKCFHNADHEQIYSELTKVYLSRFEGLLSCLKSYSRPGDIIWIIPDGPLHYLPFSAIPFQGEHLIKRNPLVYSPSMTAMAYSRQWGRKTTRKVLEGNQRSFLGMAVAPDDGNREFIQEIQDISAPPWWSEKRLLVNTESAKQTFIQEAERHDVIHISCHGVYAQDDPLSSYLLVSDGEKLPPSEFDLSTHEPFKLKARELLGKHFSCDLITLAACWTGQSKLFAGDTRLGLSDVFLATRTSSLIVSQWAAQTHAANYLLNRFYRYWLGGEAPVTKAHALQKSIIDTMESTENDWDLPFFWANFLLIGDWK